MTKVGRIWKIMALWQAVFLAASPLVTAQPSNLTQLYYKGSATKSHSTTTQYRQLRRLKSPRSLSVYTAISSKVVGKSVRDNLERYYWWFWVHRSSKRVDRMAREAIDTCLRVVKESNKSWFNSYKVRNSVLLISHITFRDYRVHISSDNLSWNSCILILFISS